MIKMTLQSVVVCAGTRKLLEMKHVMTAIQITETAVPRCVKLKKAIPAIMGRSPVYAG